MDSPVDGEAAAPADDDTAMAGDGEAPPGEHRGSVVRGLVEIPIIAALAVLIVVVLRAFIIQPFYIPSPSMVPQLKVNDKILVSRLSYRVHGYHRGDLVVFNAPPGVELEGTTGNSTGPVAWVTKRLGLTPRNDVLVKRVIGLPGETIESQGGHVYIDGKLLLEPYLPPGTAAAASANADFGPLVVPPHMLWVMGDNRNNSEDSHIFGPIKESSVIGRAFVRVWPLDKLSFL